DRMRKSVLVFIQKVAKFSFSNKAELQESKTFGKSQMPLQFQNGVLRIHTTEVHINFGRNLGSLQQQFQRSSFLRGTSFQPLLEHILQTLPLITMHSQRQLGAALS